MSKKDVAVLLGTGSIGQAIVRRVGAGKHIVLADLKLENAERAAKILEDAGFETSVISTDLGSREAILKLINAAGVSPSQASVQDILRVDLYGTAVLLEEFGKIISDGGSGVVISSQSGHRLPALPEEQNEQLAVSAPEDLLNLPFIKAINDTLSGTLGQARRNYKFNQPGNNYHAACQR